MPTNTNKAPYYNDFDSSKNYLEVLYNPERPVQARELTQSQTILSNQVATHARHIFKDGSAVEGGQLTVKTIAFIVLENSYGGFPVVLEEFEGVKVDEMTPADAATGYGGRVLKSGVVDGKKTLYLESKNVFTVGNKVKIVGESVYGTISEAGSVMFLGVDNGKFFINDRFVDVARQSIILDKFNATPSGVAGLTYVETIVTSAEDATLLDPARGYSNYGAAGADRLKIECTLEYYDEGVSPPANFVTLYEVKEGDSKTIKNLPQYSEIAKELARRTYDESGDYTVNPFALTLLDGMINKIKSISTTGVITTVVPHSVDVADEVILEAPENSGSALVEEVIDEHNFKVDKTFSGVLNDAGMTFVEEKEFSISLGKGKAYIKGYEIEKISSSEIPVNRARVKQLVENYNVVPTFGNYVIVDNVSYFLNASDVVSVNMYDAAAGGGSLIGTGKVFFMRWHSGSKGSSATKYRLYILEMTFNSTKSFALVRSFKNGSFVANVAAESIITGNAVMNSSASSALFYPIPQSGVATLSPGGEVSTSYTSHEYFTGPATGSNVTFSLGSETNSYFYGPVGANFAGTDIETTLYHFVNSTTGSGLAVSSMIISNGGRQLDVTFTGAGGTVAALIPVQFTMKAPRSKTRQTTTVVIPAAEVNSSSPRYLTNLVDIIKINSVLVNNTGSDVKDRFSLDTGQRDTIYDYGSINLRPGQTISQAHPLHVSVDHYVHSGSGYFSVDSYPDKYKDIPSYTSTSTGAEYSLTDVIDFRPSKTNAGVPIPNIPISADYEFYLPRRDVVVVNAAGEFSVVEGRPDVIPQYPKPPEDSMTLYKLDVPPFTKRGTDCQTRYVDNKRYTMRDIGRLEKRIDRVEYYTALSLLEFDTKNKSIFDENGFERFKNGFLVDSFTGHGVGNVNSGDYKCSVDPANNYCRPPFKSYNFGLNVLSRTGVVSNGAADEVGEIITLPYDEDPYLYNDVASKSESVNPFLVIDIVGGLECNPSSDDWVDTTKAPAIMVNLEGDQDAWESPTPMMPGEGSGFGSQWNSWESTWTGVDTLIGNNRARSVRSNANPNRDTFGGGGSLIGTRNPSEEVRTGGGGSGNTGGGERIEQSIGEYLVDVNIAYFMRAVSITVTGRGLRKNRDYHVFIDDRNVNSMVTPASGYAPVSEGVVKTDSSGVTTFTLSIPGGVFRTGERIITVIDDIQANKENATSYASYVFHSSGLLQTKRESIISVRTPPIIVERIIERVPITVPIQPIPTWRESEGGQGEGDPLAQTFFVSGQTNPYGVFLSSIELFIRAKPAEDIPLQVQLRPTVNGFPDSNIIIPFSNVFKPWSEVVVPTLTSNMASIQAAPTKIDFAAPVYLEPNKEYAVVVLANSTEYEAYISVMGQKILGTDIIINNQVSLGSLFKSQNSRTWSPFQNEDLMMKLNKCSFNTLALGNVVFDANHSSDVFINEFRHNIEVANFNGATSTGSQYRVKTSSSLVLDQYVDYEIKVNQRPASEKCVLGDGDFLSKITLHTTHSDVSPVIDVSRNSVTAVHNIVNNLGLIKEGFTITSGGSGYVTPPEITISGGGGMGATADAVVQGGVLTDIIITNQGSGYTSAPTVTVGSGSATIVYAGFEDGPSGGNAKARYITRNIALADGFETDFITVTFDVNKQFGTDVLVFYKAVSPDDPEIIDDKDWVLMKKKTDRNVISGSEDEFTEVEYIPVTPTIEYTSNGYTFDKANIIAVKVVMLSGNTAVVPKLKNFRVITTAP